jgi:hypothetical protein
VTPSTRTGPLIAAIIVAVVSGPLAAKEHRSREVTREFQLEHPCPSNGSRGPSGIEMNLMVEESGGAGRPSPFLRRLAEIGTAFREAKPGRPM